MVDQIRIGQVIDALVQQIGDRPGWRFPTGRESMDESTVWDGPEWQKVEDHAPGGHVVIGWPGEFDSPVPAASTTWESGPIASSNRPRDEVTAVTCLATAQKHETVKDARDACMVLLAEVAAVCREDPSLGIDTAATVGGVRTITYVTAGSFTQLFGPNGFTAELQFTVTYKTRV
jgi:hypothetical protein